jgi:DNA mismatch endonuclease (patch repair protein)
MVDTLTKQERSERMGRVKGADTKPEMVVRRLVHAMGYRYRLHGRDLPGKPDIVFRSRKKVIFVHGCFWHRHPGCKLARIPKTRLDFWVPKLEGNRERDIRNQQALGQMGWRYLVIWECEIGDRGDLENRILEFLGGSERETITA